MADTYLTEGFFNSHVEIEVPKRLGFFNFFEDITEDEKHVKIKGFPYAWFNRLVKKKYETSKITKLYELVGLRMFGRSTIKVHKFFIPELLYIMNQGGKGQPKKLMYEIIQKTWVRDIFAEADPPSSCDLRRVARDMKVELFDWQKEFIELYDIKRQRAHLHGTLLSFGCGLGKTITGLATLKAVDCDCVVIIAPKSTLVDVWQDHLTRFFKKPQKVYMVGRDMPFDADYYIFNYEAMDKIDAVMKFLKTKRKVGIIVDESQNFLKIKSQRTQNLIDLRTKLDCDNVLMMSGTPVKGVGVEVMPLLRVLDSFFDDEAQSIFIKALGVNTTMGTDILHSRLNLMMHRRTMEEVYELPPITEETIKIKISDGNQYTIASVKKELERYMWQRIEFHKINMPVYKANWDKCVATFKADPKIKNTHDFQRWLEIVRYLIRSGYNRFDKWCVTETAWANKYEKDVLAPSLDKDLRDKFLECKSKIKYLELCVQGEVLGYLDKLRSEMVVKMCQEGINVGEIIANAVKKVIFFTTYVNVLKTMDELCENESIMSICLYGANSKDAPRILEKFRDNPDVECLIATIQTLATGVTLTAANTVVFLNDPWRQSDREQALHRIHRIGQDTECFVYTLSLDTGSASNLSDRTAEILAWSKEMTDAIVDGKKFREAVGIIDV